MADIPQLPGPIGEPTGTGGSAGPEPNPQSNRRRRRPPPQIPTREAILEALSRMLALVPLGVISSQQANTFRGIADTLLRHLSADGRGAASGPSDLERLRQLILDQPFLLDALQGILTDDQLDQLVDDEEANENVA